MSDPKRYWNYGKVLRLIDCYTTAQIQGGAQALELGIQADVDRETWSKKILTIDEDYTGVGVCKFEVIRSRTSITARLLDYIITGVEDV